MKRGIVKSRNLKSEKTFAADSCDLRFFHASFSCHVSQTSSSEILHHNPELFLSQKTEEIIVYQTIGFTQTGKVTTDH